MPVLETIAINLAATGLAAGGATSVEKVRSVLRERRFSEEIDDLETEFNTLLRDGFIDTLSEVDGVTAGDVERNWDAIAGDLDDIDVVFQTEEEAVSVITAAIGAGLGYSLESDPQRREAISGAVAGVYRDIVRTFEAEIAGTELADQLSHRADIELTRTVNEVTARLEEIERQQRRQRDVELREQGFICLSPLYFERQTPEPPARCWRTGFELAEVEAGYAVKREAKRDDGTRQRLSDELLRRLRNRTDCVVLGPPGSGKSTICKQVACQWYETEKTVFYRPSDHARPLSRWETLAEWIRRAEGRVLVVVEDAIRDEVVDVFQVIEQFRQDPQVTFLLDAREGEWHGSDTKLTDARLQEIKDSELHHKTLPRVDERECERIIEHFEAATGSTVADPPEELFAQIRTASGVGEILQLSYHLSFYAADATGDSPHSTGVTSLEKSVQTLIDRQRSDDEDLSIKMGVLVNLLNATDIGAHPELLHGLADSEADHRTLNRLLERYEGTLVFAERGSPVTEQVEPFRTNHEFWSTLYLQELLTLLGDRAATRLFEECLDRLFTLFEDAEQRTEINRWFRREMPFFTELKSATAEEIDGFVERLFDLGRRQPVLAPLYGTTKFTAVDPPSVCSPDITARIALWRGIMYFHGSEFDAAADEFDAAIDLVDGPPELSAETTTEIEGWCLNYLGAIERTRGDLSQARERHQKSHDQFQEIENALGVAFSLYNLGRLYRVKSDLDAAQRYLEEALEAFDGTGERRYVSNTLNTLGLVLRDQGEFKEAETRLRQSRENARESGDERSEARCLNHLGEVKKYQSEFQSAEEYYQRALKLARKIGDTQCRAWLVHNLGDLAYKRGNLEPALEYFRRSKDLGREIGNHRGVAITLNYMAEIEATQGDLERAEAHIAEGLDIVTEVGDKRREAELLKTRGIVARNCGRLDAARDSLTEALGLFEEIGDRKWRADTLIELAAIALKRRAIDRAEELLTEGLEIKRSINDREGVVRALGGLGKVAQACGDLSIAERRYRESRDIATEIGDKEGQAYSLGRLGELSRERGDLEGSRSYLSESRSLFVAIGDRRRLARIDRQRGLTALAGEEFSTAREQFSGARDRFKEVGDELGVATTLADLGELAYATDRTNEAASKFGDAVERLREIGANEVAIEHAESLVEIYEQMGGGGGELATVAQEIRQEAIDDPNNG